MKYLSIVLLLFPFALLAQDSTAFLIDSLPSEGLFLDSGWKWHEGDNPDWAKAGFDDSNWEDIDLTKQLPDLPQVGAAEIGWFRIHIDVDSMAFNTPFSASLSVMGAAEVYFNDKLMKQIGIVSKNAAIEKAYFTPVGLPFYILFSKQEGNVIAVRYSLTRRNFYFPKHAYMRSTPFDINLQQEVKIDDTQLRYVRFSLALELGWGFFFGLAFIHFAFYYYLPTQKANFLFGLSMIAHGVALLSFNFTTETLTVATFTTVILIRHLALIIYIALISLSLHSYLKQLLTKWYWFIVGVLVFGYAFLFTDINWKLELVVLSSVFAIGILYYIIILRKSIKAGNKEGLMIYYMGIVCFAAYIVRISADSLIYSGMIEPKYGFISYWSLFINYFSITFGMSMTLAGDFARTSSSLLYKQKEVQQLSNEKLRIAADMHDDIGSDLSALNLKAEMIRQKVKSGKQPISEIDNLVDFTRDIAKKVREVIWTVNARHDSLSSVVNYFDTYADDFFEPTNITVRTSLPKDIPQIDINGENRKMLLMCFKEALNNVLKHAKANELNISFTTDNALFTISIQDNGVGFNPVLLRGSTAESNGLMNMQERMTGIGGQCRIQTSPQGTVVVFSLPI